MNSIAHLEPSRGKYAAINVMSMSVVRREVRRPGFPLKVALLAFGMGGLCCLVLLVAAVSA